MNKCWVIFMVFALTACGTTAATPTAIAAVAVALTAADQAALACIANNIAICVTNKTLIKTAAQAAYTAVKTAEASNSAADLAAAQTAINNLSAMVPAQ